MRVCNGLQDSLFKEWVGSLPYNSTLHGSILILLYVSQLKSILKLIGLIYLKALLHNRDPTAFQDWAILTTCNSIVNELNMLILQRFPRTLQTYQSVNSTDANKAEEGID
jgi:hypothetical protein